MGAMNKGGNRRIQCTAVCNPHTVYGEYLCEVCHTFTDDKRCTCCGSPTAGHDTGKHNEVAGINRAKLVRMQNSGTMNLPPRELRRQRKHRG